MIIEGSVNIIFREILCVGLEKVCVKSGKEKTIVTLNIMPRVAIKRRGSPIFILWEEKIISLRVF